MTIQLGMRSFEENDFMPIFLSWRSISREFFQIKHNVPKNAQFGSLRCFVKEGREMLGWFKKNESRKIYAAIDGYSIPLETVNDPAFASKSLGDGIAIKPSGNRVVSPCDGIMTVITPTKHAFCITGEDGLELMVHIGIDTVELKGEGFTTLLNAGDKVKKGEPVIEFDSALMKEKGVDMTTMVILLSQGNHTIHQTHSGVQVAEGRDVIIEYK